MSKFHSSQKEEIINHRSTDQHLKSDQKFTLLQQIGFAGLVNEVGNFQHPLVSRKSFDFSVFNESKNHSEQAHQKSCIEKVGSSHAHSKYVHRNRQIRNS